MEIDRTCNPQKNGVLSDSIRKKHFTSSVNMQHINGRNFDNETENLYGDMLRRNKKVSKWKFYVIQHNIEREDNG